MREITMRERVATLQARMRGDIIAELIRPIRKFAGDITVASYDHVLQRSSLNMKSMIAIWSFSQISLNAC